MAGESSGSPIWGLAPGAVVAGYRVEARIGAGGMAVVFRAMDAGLGRTVALKVLAPALVGDREFRERFIRESRAAAAVDHPHIIPVYAAGEADGVLYIAMRYVPSGDLRELLRRDGKLTSGRASRLLFPLASALDIGHLAGLVHRDVKPANILIDTSTGMADHPYLADFGLAKGSGPTAGVTGTGQFIGTLEYAAPEQISGGRAVPQTDQYALACAAFTMLTGAAPFPREEPTAVLWAHMSEPPPPVTALRPDLPRGIDQVLARAMAKTPEERYRTCAEFAEEFRAALGVGTFDAQAPGSAPPAAPAVSAAGLPAALVPADLPMPASYADTVTSLPSGSAARQAGKDGARRGLTADIAAPSPPPGPDSGDGLSAAEAAPGSESASGGPGGGEPAAAGEGPAAGDRVGNGNAWLTQPSPPGYRKRRRRALAIAAVTAVVMASGGGAVLAVHPWTHSPVLQPTGLTVQGKTTSSLTIHWSVPATGPLPDKYEILRDGAVIGTALGSATNYTDSGLAPDSPYDYQVIAVRGGEQSPISQSLPGHTTAPPLSDARLDWAGDVTYKMESLYPADSKWYKQPGSSWQDPWAFTPRCSAGPCSVLVNGAWDGDSFTSTLTRSGSTYSGTARLPKDSFYCDTLSDTMVTTLTIKITTRLAGTQGTEWVVTSFSGTATLYTAPPADNACHADTAQLTVKSG